LAVVSDARQRLVKKAKLLFPLMLTALTVRALAQSATPASVARSSATPIAFSAPARADNREPIRIHYKAPDACPGDKAFLDDVLARTPRARAAAAHELARVFHVRVVSKRGESFGEISMTRPGESTPVRLSAVGKCPNVLNTLAQFAAIGLDSSAALASAQEPELPQNPYLNWNGPIAPPLPDNPYRHWSGTVAPDLPENPYRETSAAITPDLPDNPDLNQLPAAPGLPDNPYRNRSSGAAR
jgi:hypothetical protein